MTRPADPLTALGAAWCGTEALRTLVGHLLGVPAPELDEVRADEVAYDQVAITTAGRYRVRGVATVGPRRVPWSVFVKVIEPWHRSPLFQLVPEQLRDEAARLVPWRTEALLYRSDVADRLPPGLTVPRALRIDQLHDEAYAIWLADIPVLDIRWDQDRYRSAAHSLGRLAAATALRPLAGIGETDGHRGATEYWQGRVRNQVLPMLESDELWRHPLMSAFDAVLRDRMRVVARCAGEIAAELDAFPRGTAHGDACPNNLLVTDADRPDLVMIDFGFWSTQPLGFDLGQLQLGEVQLGRRPAAQIEATDRMLVEAFVAGLRAEGCSAPVSTVRRAHALQMVLYSGLSAFPLEHLGAGPTPELHRVAAERAALARATLDLLDEVGGVAGPR